MSSNWSCSKILCYGHPCTSILQVASLPAVASLLSSKVPLQQRYQCKSCQLLAFCHWFLQSPPMSMVFFQSQLLWTQMQTRTCIRCLWTWVEGDAALGPTQVLDPRRYCANTLLFWPAVLLLTKRECWLWLSSLNKFVAGIRAAYPLCCRLLMKMELV